MATRADVGVALGVVAGAVAGMVAGIAVGAGVVASARALVGINTPRNVIYLS